MPPYLILFLVLLLSSCSEEDLNYDFREDYDWRNQRTLDSAEVAKLEKDFEKVLKSGSEKFDSKYIQVAVRYHDARVVPFWRWLLRTDHPHLIATALRSLGRIRSDEAVAIVSDYVDHQNPVVRQFAVNSLGHLRQYATLEQYQPTEKDSTVLQVYSAHLQQFAEGDDFAKKEHAKKEHAESAFDFLPRFARSSFKKETFEYYTQGENEKNKNQNADVQSMAKLWAGQPVFSPVSGRVIAVNHNPDEGVVVEIQAGVCKGDTSNPSQTNTMPEDVSRYPGLDNRLLVEQDDCVFSGQMIGEIGAPYTLAGGNPEFNN